MGSIVNWIQDVMEKFVITAVPASQVNANAHQDGRAMIVTPISMSANHKTLVKIRVAATTLMAAFCVIVPILGLASSANRSWPAMPVKIKSRIIAQKHKTRFFLNYSAKTVAIA
jgi:hypothetical protein